jgi:MFS family permease
MSRVGDALRETGTSLGTVFGNRNLRLLNLAFAGSSMGDWAYATAITVWAYDVGGARAIGAWYTIRLLLMATVTPFASMLVDRISRRTVMVSTDLIRGTLGLAIAALIGTAAPPLMVFAVATLAALMTAPFRPAVGAIMPLLARTPGELTAANGTINTLESLAFFLGPAIGGLLLTAFDVPVVVIFNAATFLWSALLVLAIRIPAKQPQASEAVVAGADAREADGARAADADASGGFLAESMAGFRALWRDPDLRLVSGVYCSQTIVAGASAVFIVEMAVQMTSFGPRGVGYLDSVFGIGALLGGLVAIGRAPAGRLATDFGLGVLFWGLPLLLTAVWPQMWAAFLAVFVMGGANPVADVNASTILQRTTEDSVLGRVFGALDTALIASMGLGAAAMPLLIDVLGFQWALAALALIVSAAVFPAFPRLGRMDVALREPAELVLLRRMPLFAPLEPKALEAIVGQLLRVEVPAGETVIREGEEGDRFYVIESGALVATFQDRELSHMGPGDPFGEIALLHDVPRTATVTADADSVLLALERADFLATVTGSAEVNTRAEDLASRRIPTY